VCWLHLGRAPQSMLLLSKGGMRTRLLIERRGRAHFPQLNPQKGF
jgi:hypothetical protein